ncbi:hypothetical protein HWV62_11612 [Athelia sp. TMB]|nr:hypothetical protein HWV62_11612 [Athelia sp. TMB]
MGVASQSQLQWLLGTSLKNYTAWAIKHGYSPVVDEIGEGARLLWVGERRYDRVILYIPGGGFVLPIYAELIDFVRHLQCDIGHGKTGLRVGVAILDYGLAPDVQFPTHLRQANIALSHLFSAGVSPQDLQIVADSAGGIIALQVLSHALHPKALDSIPRSPLAAMNDGSTPRLKGIYLISPGVYHDVAHQSACVVENGAHDIMSAACYWYWCGCIPSAPREKRPFIEAATAPLGWFNGTERLVERVLVTAGQFEIMRDHIVDFCSAHLANVKQSTMHVVKGGVHGDPILIVGQPEGTDVTRMVVGWLKVGFDH